MVAAGALPAVVFGPAVVAVTSPLLKFVGERSELVADQRLVGHPAAALVVSVLTVAWTFTFGLAGLVILEAGATHPCRTRRRTA